MSRSRRLTIARLEEARLGALEDRIDADLALGRHAALVGELEALVAEHPLRERLHGQLMLALYRMRDARRTRWSAYQRARRAAGRRARARTRIRRSASSNGRILDA